MAPSPPCQLLPVFNVTRAQREMQGCPPTLLRFIGASGVVTPVGPSHGWFWFTTPLPIPIESLGFPHSQLFPNAALQGMGI